MNSARNSSGPGLATEARETLTDSLQLTGRIGHTVDAALEVALWKLVSGEYSLSDFSPAFQSMWCVAADQGRASANRDEIERLTWERDLWFGCYTNGWTPGEYMRRQTSAMWAEAVAA